MVRHPTRRLVPAKWWSTFTRPVSMQPTTKCDWEEGDTALIGSHISLVGTSPALLARLERASPISPSGMRYSE